MYSQWDDVFHHLNALLVLSTRDTITQGCLCTRVVIYSKLTLMQWRKLRRPHETSEERSVMRHANTNAIKRGESSPDLCTESYPVPGSHRHYEAVVAKTSKAKQSKPLVMKNTKDKPSPSLVVFMWNCTHWVFSVCTTYHPGVKVHNG